MRDRLARVVLFGFAGVATAACSGGTACTDQFVYGLAVSISDSLTLAAPASATLIARSESFVDSVGPVTPFQYQVNGPRILLVSALGERPGTYDVTIRSPGYQDWIRNGVKITADECHVHPVSLKALLQR